jgi:signal transduction histidine kinase
LAEPSLAPRPGTARHALFGAAQVLLVLVAAWWVVLLSRTVSEQEALARRLDDLRARAVAAELAGRADLAPGQPVPLPGWRLVAAADAGADAPRVAGTALALEPTPEARDEVARALRRQRVMVIGEGALLVVLVAASVALLTRLVLAERRRRHDVEAILARVAHEMKTPLAGLKALLQTLREGRVPPERLPALAALGLEQAEREESLIENLLAARRTAPGARRRRPRPIDLSAFLSAYHEDRRLHVEQHGVLSLEAARGVVALADPDDLRTILDNLTDNAFKYGARRVTLRLAADSAWARVAVADDGQGFPPEGADRLFRAFERGADARASAGHGTGLGLSISRALARAAGGDLTATSPGVGRGTTFELRLRAAPAPALAAAGGTA